MPRTKSAKQSTKRSAGGPGGAAYDPAFRHHDSSGFAQDTRGFDDNPTSFENFAVANNGIDFPLVDEMFDENLHNGAFGDPDPFSMELDISNIDPSNISQFGNGSGGHPSMSGTWSGFREGTQSDIIRRSENASQNFGQITPPDDLTPVFKTNAAAVADDSTQSQEEIAKLNRAQRARNAANKRHSKSKKRKDSPLDDTSKVDGSDEDDPSKSTNIQREKNRIAAAKCRAKKKQTSEEMQDVHREGSRAHTYLSREVRELRDQKAFLRNVLLMHEPGVCQCDAIHRFNMAQAQQMAMGVGAMIPQVMSPSQGSVSSMATPASDMFAERRYPMMENAPSRHHSFSHGFQNIALEQMSGDPLQAPQFGEYS